MTYLPKPKVSHPSASKNSLGLTVRDYEGALSTLCAGCGHDSVTAAIVRACFELSIEPHRVAKMSGIGCSSKTPAYFLGGSHGFNSVHGRMPSVTTGANAACRDLYYLAVSGDGDTASIGLGQFVHAIRRKLNMLYIVENNGCYGLTKGQFSATATAGSTSKGGIANSASPIDLCALAIQVGAGFVARSFSGDKDQLVPLIQAGLNFRGFSIIDVISPCVSFNNHEGSTKSYSYFREHEEMLNVPDWISSQQEIVHTSVDGVSESIELHDGSRIVLSRVRDGFDFRDRATTLTALEKAKSKEEILTGLLFCDDGIGEMHDDLGTTITPLRDIPLTELCPGEGMLQKINASLF